MTPPSGSPPAVPPVPGRPTGPAAGDQAAAAADSAVAGLAREVDGLRRTIEPLLGLSVRVDDLTRLVTDLTTAVAALTARKSAQPCPSWLLLPADPALAGQVLDELTSWLQVVYLRYPDGADHLPECWVWHPDVVEELLWLMHAWAAAYQGLQASVALVGDWHDRQRPGVVRRIKTAAGSCSIEAHQTRPGWTRRPSGAPQVPGLDHTAAVATWWGAHRDEQAPQPPPRPTAVATTLHGRGHR